MSTTLKIDNFASINVKERTSLAVDINAAATSLTLVNNNNIVASDYILVGRPGSETGEIRVAASVSGATILVTNAITLHHDAYEDVTALIGNQINIYRAPNTNNLQPADGTFTKLATVNIDPDQLSTTYTDANGGDGYWYKFTYFNQTNLAETSLSDSGAARGGGVGNYATLDDIRSAAGFEKNYNISDSYIDGFRRSAQDQVNGSLAGVYVLPFTTPINGFINRITIQLAAGQIKLDQFGKNNEEGQAMIDWAEAQLKSIRGGDLTLTDSTGAVLPQPGGGGTVPGGGMGFSGYPNNKTQDDGFHFYRTKRY